MSQTQVSFVFDDGFTKSCLQVADLFEARNLAATFAVLVNHDGFMVDFPKGDFDLWNELLQRGHEIHPHGWDHSDLSKLPLNEATKLIGDCLDYFSQHLNDFDPAASVYHLTYNRSTEAVDDVLLQRVRAIRTTGVAGDPGTGLNTTDDLQSRKFGCAWHGPDRCDQHLHQSLETASDSDALHFCYMLHGLGDEGWGPISHDALAHALDMIEASPGLTYHPIGSFAAKHWCQSNHA